MMKKRLIALLLALAVLLCAGGTAYAAQTEVFTDVPEGSFYYDAVNWAVEKGITQGMGGGLFQPNGTCNRAQVVTFLWRCAGEPVVTGANGFTDVPEGSFYYDAVNWAVEKGITQGMGGGLFQPDGTCNRAQVVTFLWRYAGEPAVSGGNGFTDVPEGSFYDDAVNWAVEKGITQGMGGGLFQPDGTCNRAQVVTFLYRYAADLETAPPPDTENPDMGDWA